MDHKITQTDRIMAQLHGVPLTNPGAEAVRAIDGAFAERDQLRRINAELLKCLTAIEQRASDLYHCNRSSRQDGLDDIRSWAKAAASKAKGEQP